MKKKIISIILTMAMIVTMFSNFSIVASAGESFESATELENGVAVEVTGNFAEEMEYFKFVPEESGYYSVYTDYDGEEVLFAGNIYNADFEFLEFNSTYDYYGNYYMQSYLTAGETYYMETSCYDRVDYSVVCKKLPAISSLSLESFPDQMEYYEGCLYTDLTGLKLKITLEDGTEDYLEYDYGNCLIGDYIIDISERYDDKTDEYSNVYIKCADKELEFDYIILETPVDYITVDKAPDFVYYWGDYNYGYGNEDSYTFYPGELEGMIVTIHYKDGTSATYNSDDMLEGHINGYHYEVDYVSNANQIGEIPVTFTYMNVSTTYNVKLVESPVESIEVVKAPTEKTIYYPFTPTYYGMQIKINKKDGTSDIVEVRKENSYRYGYGDVLVEDESLVSYLSVYHTGDSTYIYYIDQEVEYTDMVYNFDKNFNSIEVENVSVNPKNMIINLIYGDGSKKEQIKVLEVDEYSVFNDFYMGYVLTELGYADTYITKEYDIDGNFKGYYVSIEYYETEVEVSMKSGDVNFDGTINATDALDVLKHAAKIKDLDSSAANLADITADGNINAEDALEILKYAAKLRPSL